MKNASLLVVVGRSFSVADLEPLTESATKLKLHLSVLVLGAMPPIPLYTYEVGAFGGYSIPYDWQAEVDKTNTELDGTRQKIAHFLAKQGVSADVSVVSAESAALPDAVAYRSLTCDLMVVSNDLREDSDLFKGLLRASLFQAPTGVLLNGMKRATTLRPDKVIVAWNAGLPAARAIHCALPVLRLAKNVTIAIFDPEKTRVNDGEDPGANIARWLGHHGCSATIKEYSSGGELVGVGLLKRAKESNADLIVMGAFGHSRLREVVFGGTTRTVIEQSDCPVILSH